MPRGYAIAVTCAGVAACGGGPQLEPKAAADLGCPEGQIQLEGSHYTTVKATGCGKQMLYRFDYTQPAIYILASKRNGTLYCGVTSDLRKRVWEHKNDVMDGFTKAHAVHDLVFYELHDNMESAITREKRIKKWNRSWKLQLIESKNPAWKDLWNDIL